MFGDRYFGPRFFGDRYFGPNAGGVVLPADYYAPRRPTVTIAPTLAPTVTIIH
jgi:hypothetical protein